MHYKPTRKLARNLHIIAGTYNIFYVYSALHEWHYALKIVQYVTFPLLLITGIWLFKGKKIWNYLHRGNIPH